MVEPTGRWQHLYDLARQEVDLQKQRDLCAQARTMVQERLLQLDGAGADERQALEKALRLLWTLENTSEGSERPC